MTKIFRLYNVFEYKNPLDRLEPNDYDKGLVVARLYKAIKHPTLLTLDDFTVTFVCIRYPGAFLRMLDKRRLAVEKASPVPGLYQVAGDWMPVQVLVLKGLTRPEDAYMFTPFLTRRKPIRTDATALLFRKYMDDPTNPYLQELVEFKFKNELVNKEEMEVLTAMVAQANVAEKTLMKQLLGKHLSVREMAEDAKIEGKMEGKIEAKQDVIQ